MKLSVAVMAVAIACLSSVVTSQQMTMDDARAYLIKYHYAGENHPDPRMRDMMNTDQPQATRMGLMTFQHFNGLPMTGELDEATLEMMSWPRCGDPDVYNMDDVMSMEELMNPDSRRRRRRRKRYVLGTNNPWFKTSLTYRITQYTPDMSQAQVRSEIARAFAVWSDVTPLRFTEVTSGNADIIIFFAFGAHGDGGPFDGPGRTLAHAYLPINGGRVDIEGDSHFDEAERWTINTFQGINLFQVAAHEFGHALGLRHSQVQNALMAPYYQGYIPNFRLPTDDIMGIQALYGRRPPGGGDDDDDDVTTTTTRRPGATPPPGMPNYCVDSQVDAATLHIEGNRYALYVFRENTFASVSPPNGILTGYPKTISEEWPGLTGPVDAALFLQGINQRYWFYNRDARRWEVRTRRSPAYTVLFKGRNYYLYTADRTPVSGNPHSLTELGLPSSVSSVDAAFVYPSNDRVYIFTGSTYYRFSKTYNTPAVLSRDSGYPRGISAWGFGSALTSVDSAIDTSGQLYFMKDNQIWRYDSTAGRLADGYPVAVSDAVLGCNLNIQMEMSFDTGSYEDLDDGETSAADAQTLSYVTLMLTNCLLLLMALCFF